VQNRDTSVLVRLRPAWEDLRSYLTAKGRKRFEVFVCTMAERDYALEMWRLLDPEAHLINSKQLLNRVVCVKSGKGNAHLYYLEVLYPCRECFGAWVIKYMLSFLYVNLFHTLRV